MATTLRRFTISVTPSMAEKLDRAKQQRYYRESQNAMIQDLISRGLAALQTEMFGQTAIVGGHQGYKDTGE